MAEWVMFDAAFSDVSGIRRAIFSVSGLDVNLWQGM